jgi:hypothetical protein
MTETINTAFGRKYRNTENIIVKGKNDKGEEIDLIKNVPGSPPGERSYYPGDPMGPIVRAYTQNDVRTAAERDAKMRAARADFESKKGQAVFKGVQTKGAAKGKKFRPE